MILENIAFIFGIAFVSLIGICIIYSLITIATQSIDKPLKGNKKLLKNIDRMDNK